MNGWLSWKHIKKNWAIWSYCIVCLSGDPEREGDLFEAIIASDDIWIASGIWREVLNQLKSEPRDYKEGVNL
jgi:hypothetical protein